MKRLSLLVVVCLAFCIFYAGGAWGAEFCVSNATALQTALTTAGTNGTDDIIKVVQGTYAGNFTYYSSQAYSISLYGGYTAGCLSQVLDPTKTILDAGNTGTVLDMSNNSSSGGNIYVSYLTIHNGATGGLRVDVGGPGTSGNIEITRNIVTQNSATNSGGGIYAHTGTMAGQSGTVTVSNNIVNNNYTPSYGGGIYAVSAAGANTAGTVTLSNNIVAGNISMDSGGGIYAYSYSPSNGGNITLTNNTITGNWSDNGYGGGLSLNNTADAGSYGNVNVYNNIVWGNTAYLGTNDIYLLGNGYNYGLHNDYDFSAINTSWDTGSGNNISLDPQFVNSSNGNYHLRSTSPCIDTGNNSAPEITSMDIDGDNRTIDGNNNGTATVDMGADEYILAFYANFTGYGLYKYSNSTWRQINTVLATSMAAAGVNLYASFTGYGLYKYNSTTWTKINTVPATSMAATGPYLYAGFPGYGLYQYNGTAWTQITSYLIPDKMAATGTYLYANFTGHGLYKYNGTSWTWINIEPAGISASGSDLYASFTGYGTYKYNGTDWTKINWAVAAGMVAAGSDLYASFTGYGLYKYDGVSWIRINTVLADDDSMAAGYSSFVGSFSGYGLYKYEGTSWSKINIEAASLVGSN